MTYIARHLRVSKRNLPSAESLDDDAPAQAGSKLRGHSTCHVVAWRGLRNSTSIELEGGFILFLLTRRDGGRQATRQLEQTRQITPRVARRNAQRGPLHMVDDASSWRYEDEDREHDYEDDFEISESVEPLEGTPRTLSPHGECRWGHESHITTPSTSGSSAADSLGPSKARGPTAIFADMVPIGSASGTRSPVARARRSVTEDVPLPGDTAHGRLSPASKKPAELEPRMRLGDMRQQLAAESRSSLISSMESATPPRIRPGHWKLGTKIGKGSFGSVYIGLNEQTGQLMAVKVLPVGGAEENAHSLHEEIELMRRLNHPHIVRYLGAQVDVAKGSVYIFQEWMSGGSVSHLIEKFGPLRPSVVRNYTVQVLHGLNYLHGHGIIHMDIKGGNILVDERGTVKLADFGASKQLGMNGTTELVAQTLKGTPYFLSPEVLKDNCYSRKADIWSIGGAVLQMLTGDPPWKQLNFSSAVALMFHISAAQDPPPIPDDLPVAVRRFLLRCFDRNPASRPSAGELLEDIFLRLPEVMEAADEESDDGVLRSLRELGAGATPRRTDAQQEANTVGMDGEYTWEGPRAVLSVDRHGEADGQPGSDAEETFEFLAREISRHAARRERLLENEATDDGLYSWAGSRQPNVEQSTSFARGNGHRDRASSRHGSDGSLADLLHRSVGETEMMGGRGRDSTEELELQPSPRAQLSEGPHTRRVRQAGAQDVDTSTAQGASARRKRCSSSRSASSFHEHLVSDDTRGTASPTSGAPLAGGMRRVKTCAASLEHVGQISALSPTSTAGTRPIAKIQHVRRSSTNAEWAVGEDFKSISTPRLPLSPLPSRASRTEPSPTLPVHSQRSRQSSRSSRSSIFEDDVDPLHADYTFPALSARGERSRSISPSPQPPSLPFQRKSPSGFFLEDDISRMRPHRSPSQAASQPPAKSDQPHASEFKASALEELQRPQGETLTCSETANSGRYPMRSDTGPTIRGAAEGRSAVKRLPLQSLGKHVGMESRLRPLAGLSPPLTPRSWEPFAPDPTPSRGSVMSSPPTGPFVSPHQVEYRAESSKACEGHALAWEGDMSCLDSRSTSVMLVEHRTDLERLVALETPTLRDIEQDWRCQKKNCGRLNSVTETYCGHCATVKASSGARSEESLVLAGLR